MTPKALDVLAEYVTPDEDAREDTRDLLARLWDGASPVQGDGNATRLDWYEGEELSRLLSVLPREKRELWVRGALLRVGEPLWDHSEDPDNGGGLLAEFTFIEEPRTWDRPAWERYLSAIAGREVRIPDPRPWLGRPDPEED